MFGAKLADIIAKSNLRFIFGGEKDVLVTSETWSMVCILDILDMFRASFMNILVVSVEYQVYQPHCMFPSLVVLCVAFLLTLEGSRWHQLDRFAAMLHYMCKSKLLSDSQITIHVLHGSFRVL